MCIIAITAAILAIVLSQHAEAKTPSALQSATATGKQFPRGKITRR
jgi:hypothetical protein